MTGAGIVVGYDGSPGSEDAVAWAAREAQARESTLTVCLAEAPGYPAPLPEDTVPRVGEQHDGERLLAAGVQLAGKLTGELEVLPLLVAGSPAAALCTCSDRAVMIVVGSRGQGGLPGLPIGSVSLQVAAHARGQVVVVRGRWQPVNGRSPRPVVVGTEGSPASEEAVKMAFEEAELRETYLLAVCALADSPGVLGNARRITDEFEHLMSRHEQQHPAVTVRRHVSQGSARKALLEAAASAQMLVVGARGRGGLPGMALGSVGLAVLAYAACPVGIAHPHDQH